MSWCVPKNPEELSRLGEIRRARIWPQQVRFWRPLESFALEGEPCGREQHDDCTDDPDRLLIWWLHANHDQEQAPDCGDHRQRAIPTSDLPGAHARPAPAMSNEAGNRRKYIRDVEENDTHSRDRCVRNKQDEPERNQCRSP